MDGNELNPAEKPIDDDPAEVAASNPWRELESEVDAVWREYRWHVMERAPLGPMYVDDAVTEFSRFTETVKEWNLRGAVGYFDTCIAGDDEGEERWPFHLVIVRTPDVERATGERALIGHICHIHQTTLGPRYLMAAVDQRLPELLERCTPIRP